MKMYRWFYRVTLVAVVFLAGITVRSSAKTIEDNSINQVLTPGTGEVDDANIHYIGRWDWVDAPFVTRGYWPGVYLRVNFIGTTSIGVQLGGVASFYAQIDNGQYVLFSDANGVVNLASNLAPDSVHVLKIAGQTEHDIVRFQKLIMDVGGVTVPSPSKDVIEFVGDSITGGKGSSLEALSSYPKYTTDNLGTDYVNISYTGVCLVDGVRCGWFTGMSRGFFRLKTIPNSVSEDWDFSRYQPKAVVINLGTNDASYGVTDTQFESSYISFLENIRARYANAPIFAMRTFNGFKVDQTLSAVNARRAAGDINVYYIDTSSWLNSTDYLDTYHLNDAGNTKVGQYLAAILRPYISTEQPTPTHTFTPTVLIPTNTPTSTDTSVPTNTPTETQTNTPLPTSTSTNTATYPPSATATSTFTYTPTDTATYTATPTSTPTAIPTNTPTSTVTYTDTAAIPTNTALPTFTPTATGGLQVEYMPRRSIDITTQLEPLFRVVNSTGNTIPLTQLKIRYWFTQDTARPLVYRCVYARLGCAYITGSIVQITARTDADAYLELGFIAAAGNLTANGTTNEIETLIRKDNWSNFTQSNDYSFDGTKTAYMLWTKVTLYWNGVLVWGTEPEGGPTATPTSSIPTNTPPPPTATRTNTSVPPTNTPNSNPVLRLEYMTLRSTDVYTQLEPSFRIINATTSAVPLSQLKIRYWFTRDTARPLVYRCVYARLGCANITGTTVLLTTPKPGADAYLEVGFMATAGNLAVNGTTNEIETLIRKDNWSNFTQSNDYSFDGTKTMYTQWTNVTLYQNGILIWGTEPQ